MSVVEILGAGNQPDEATSTWVSLSVVGSKQLTGCTEQMRDQRKWNGCCGWDLLTSWHRDKGYGTKCKKILSIKQTVPLIPSPCLPVYLLLLQPTAMLVHIKSQDVDGVLQILSSVLICQITPLCKQIRQMIETVSRNEEIHIYPGCIWNRWKNSSSNNGLAGSDV